MRTASPGNALFAGKKALRRMNSFYKLIYFFTSCKSPEDYRLTYRQETGVVMSKNAGSRSIDGYLKDKMGFPLGYSFTKQVHTLCPGGP